MKKHLYDYVKIYKNFISDAFCDQVVKELKEVKWREHTFYSVERNEYTSNGEDALVYYDEINSSKKLMEITWKIIHQYVCNDINFPWMNGWTAFSGTKFNRYDINTSMNEHCDHIYSLFDGTKRGVPILTVLGALNNDYEGGELIFFEDQTIDLKKGDVMVFPSNFMYPHKVCSITDGERYSFANWVW